MSKQRGTFPYPGSKTLIRRWIIDKIPEHHLYVEPFGGAASILVGKDRSPVEVYNDLNGDCVEFFRAVRDHGDELAEWIENTPYSRELFEEYVESYYAGEWPEDTVERAGRFLYVQTSCFGGDGLASGSPTWRVCKVSTRPDAGGSKNWNRKPDHVAWLKDRFKKVQVEQLDYAGVLEKYDDPETLFYLDPPYVDVGDDYYLTEDGGFDHSRFVNQLHDLKAKWLVSYDEKLPPGLEDYRTISRTKTGTMNRHLQEKTETLTMNYDMDGETMMSSYGQKSLESFGD